VRRVALVVLGLIWSPPLNLAAQAPVSIGPGQRVRLQTRSSSSWVIGTILAVDADSLHLRLSDTTSQLSVKRRAITRLEISHGMKSNAGRGARTGLLIGAAVGVLAGVAPDDQSYFTAPQRALLLGVGFGGLGALLGSIIGGRSLHERWDRVSLGEARVTLVPRGASVIVSFRL